MMLAVLIMLACGGTSADTHVMQYFYTAVFQGTNLTKFTAVGLMDGVQLVSLDGNIPGNVTPDVTCNYKASLKQHMEGERGEFLQIVRNNFTLGQGLHTVQMMYSCQISDNNTTGEDLQYSYDGEDLMILSFQPVTWITRSSTVHNTNKWDAEGKQAKHWTHFLKNKCINWLLKVVPCAKKTLEKKVPPEASVFLKHSSSPPEMVCQATGFFPKAINITWQKDGEDVQEDVELRETLPNQDGSFQKRSVLKVPAEELQKHNYTCIIQHSSLEEEKVLQVPKDGESDGGSDGGSGGGSDGVWIGVIVAVVLVGLIGAAVMIWKKKKRKPDFRLVPVFFKSRTSEVMSYFLPRSSDDNV